ncbi:M16 family metallopeptidase [Anseongella ginsenosidimutans]|nr:pitrilysin family protein [Anseongella ginsenosidimutans]QEC52037.1 insulinase family protein [Anseongella ginsenosidimutans]
MSYSLFTLKNGIRVLHNPAGNTDIVHACVVINSGSRDEPDDKTGLAHFIEHLLFKGTLKRNTFQVLNRLEAVGGDLNAYTTKEQTCIHASFLGAHLDRALDLLSDVLFRSTFPEGELAKEKGVILDELDSYRDTPEEQINDDFEEIIFRHHPLGNNILGTPESIPEFTREDIFRFRQDNYSTHEMVIGISSGAPHAKIRQLCEKHFGLIPENAAKRKRLPVNGYHPQEKTEKKPIFQAHFMLGGRSYPLDHEKKTAMLLMNNLLGGPSMSARLNLTVREKHGICYTIESGYSPMSDTGLFSIYFGTDKEKADKCLKLIHRELKKLREQPLGTTQLYQARERFKGQIALAEEARLSVIIYMSKSVLDYGRIDSLQEIFEKIDRVSAADIMDVANEALEPRNLSLLGFIPQ